MEAFDDGVNDGNVVMYFARLLLLIKDIYSNTTAVLLLHPIFLASYPLAFHHPCVSHFGS